MDIEALKNLLEAALLAAGRPLSLDDIETIFSDAERPERNALREALDALAEEYAGRAIELVQVGGGYRIQTRGEISDTIGRLWQERPARYSRALLETLALIAYRQPITRGEIEAVRGVAVASSIMRTLIERDWVRIVGHRDVPGKPAMYGTTKAFLDYFNLKSLDQLPTLAEIRDLEGINRLLPLDDAQTVFNATPTPVAAAPEPAPPAEP